MRIAFLADPLDSQSAGIHVYTREIIRAMTKLNTPHEFIIIRSEEGTEDFGTAEQVIVPIRSFPPMHLRWRQFYSIPKILVDKKVDVVIEPAHFGPFNLPKYIKRVTVIHDLTPILFPQFHGMLSSMMHRYLLPSVLRKADLVITNSEYTRQDVIQAFPFVKEKSKAILLGKDRSFYPQTDKKVLEKYGIRSPYILNVGTIEPRKNLTVLLKAFEKFRYGNTDSNIQLVFAGKKGWEMENFHRQVAESPFKEAIIFTGFFDTEDLPTLYSMAEVFVYPSHYEGFGLPVLEAMACGVSVIAANNSSLPEVGGDGALYFDGESVEDLAGKLGDLLSNPAMRKALADKGLKRAQEFSWEKAGREMLVCIEKLM